MNNNKEKLEIKTYPSIKRIDNFRQVDLEAHGITNDTEIEVYEKLDGSNISLVLDGKNKTWKAFSRNTEILAEDGNFTKALEYFKNLNIVIATEKGFFSHIDNKFTICGEWLQMAHLPYNKTHHFTWWVFDAFNGENDNRQWVDTEILKEICLNNHFNQVPFIAKTTYGEFLAKRDEYINGKTLIEGSTSSREGVVIKTPDRIFKMKFVCEDFRENIKTAPKQFKKGVIETLAEGELITPARVAKFFTKLKDQNVLPEDCNYNEHMKIIFENSKQLVNDFLDEELEVIMLKVREEIISKAKKSTAKAIKGYISSLTASENVVETKGENNEEK